MSNSSAQPGPAQTTRPYSDREPTPLAGALLGPPPLGMVGYEFAPGQLTVVYGRNGAG